MVFSSFCLVRDVVASFLTKIEPWSKTAKQPTDKDDEFSDKDFAAYSRMIRKTLDFLLYSAIKIDPDSPEAGAWGSTDIDDLLSELSDNLFEKVQREMARKLAKKLNRTVGTFNYELKRRSTEKDSPKWSPTAVHMTTDSKPVARFQGPDMKSEDIYSRFATMLSEGSGKKITTDQIRENYKYEKMVQAFYDEDAFRTKAQVQKEKAIDATVSMLSEYSKPGRFLRLLAKQVAPKDPAVGWIRPPRGKTVSGIEEGGKEKRIMDPGVSRLLFGALRSGDAVEWTYHGVRVENDLEGNSFQMLDLIFPEIGGEVFSARIPDDIGRDIKDARENEKYYIEILDYDPRKGFKVKFPDQAENVYKSAEKTVQNKGVSAKQLKSAVDSMISNYTESIIKPTNTEDLSEVVTEYLGKVIVDGKDLTSTSDLDELKQAHEERRKVVGPSGRPGKENVDRSVLKEFVEAKREQADIERSQEYTGVGLGKDVSEVLRKADPVRKASAKIADAIARSSVIPNKALFTKNTNTWAPATALKTKGTIRWLVGLALDEALPVTLSGSVPWTRLLEELFKSDILADAAKSKEFFDEAALKPFFQAMKVVLLGEGPELSEPEKSKVLSDYNAGNLTVTPEDRRDIVKILSSKGDKTMESFVHTLKGEIQKAFMDLYTRGDPDIVNIVQVSESRMKEKEEGDAEGEDKPVSTLKSRMERIKKEYEGKIEQDIIKFEEMLLKRDFVNAEKVLKSVGAPETVMDALTKFEKAPVTSPDSIKHEKTLSMIQNLSDSYEDILSRVYADRMSKMYKDLSRGEKPSEAKPATTEKRRGRPPKEPATTEPKSQIGVIKRKPGRPPKFKAEPVSPVSPESVSKDAALYRWVVKLAMSRIAA